MIAASGARSEIASARSCAVSLCSAAQNSATRSGGALEQGAAHVPRLLQRRRRVVESARSAARALTRLGIDGLCVPLPAITMRLLAISTRRMRPAWSVRLSWIVT